MYAMSDRMTQALKSSHRPMIVVKVKTVRGKVFNIPITSGSVTADSTSQDARRTISFTVSDAVGGANDLGLIPTTGQNSVWLEALQIYGNHVYAYRGVLWEPSKIGQELWEAIPPLTDKQRAPDNGAYELVPLGVFRLNSVSIAETSDGNIVITCQGTDISHNIAMNHWIAPVTVWHTKYKVPVNKTDTGVEKQYIATTVAEAIKLLINDRWPTHPSNILGEPTFNFVSIDTTTKLKAPVIMGSRTVSSSGSNSPWTDITGLASSIGATLYIDVDGNFALRPVPDPNSIPPSWSLLDGQNGLLTSVTRKIDDSKTVNYVIATGESSSNKTPLKAVAMDDDPNSPTYWQGDFGISVGYEPGRKKLTTQAGVQLAADTYLNWFSGGDESTVLEGFVNPALDAGDVVKVRRQRLGIFDKNVVVAELSKSFTDTKTSHSQITVSKTLKPITAGTVLSFFSEYTSTESIIITKDAPVGSTILNVIGIDNKPFVPNVQYGAQTVLVDPSKPSDGSVAYYIDKLVIPLDLTTPMNITCRERRTGSKQDAIRVGQYDVAGLV